MSVNPFVADMYLAIPRDTGVFISIIVIVVAFKVPFTNPFKFKPKFCLHVNSKPGLFIQ